MFTAHILDETYDQDAFDESNLADSGGFSKSSAICKMGKLRKRRTLRKAEVNIWNELVAAMRYI